MPTESLRFRSWSMTEPFTWSRAILVILAVTGFSTILLQSFSSPDWWRFGPWPFTALAVAGFTSLPCLIAAQAQKSGDGRGLIAFQYWAIFLVQMYFIADMFPVREAPETLNHFSIIISALGPIVFLLLSLSSPRTAKVLFLMAVASAVTGALKGLLIMISQ